jgi:hypothetical protein
MSGCLKAFLIGLFAFFVAGAIVVTLLVVVVGHAVHHLAVHIVGTPGRPSSLPSGASDYSGELTQDRVAGSDGRVTIGSVSATATNWARTTSSVTSGNVICGDVTIHRATINTNDDFFATNLIVGDMLWSLVPPSGPAVSFDLASSSLSAFNDYLVTRRIGDASGKVCFPDPSGSGQFVVTWQPQLLNAQRLVWIVKLP